MQIHYLSEENSVLNHFLGQIRNVHVQKDSMRFRRNIERIGEVMAYEMSKNLHYKNVEIQTPLGIKKTTQIEDDLVIIKLLYIERRMLPLNLYLEQASYEQKVKMMADYGQALKDMIAANIFPGDMLLKNFGVTRHGRVIFYDYDEVQ